MTTAVYFDLDGTRIVYAEPFADVLAAPLPDDHGEELLQTYSDRLLEAHTNVEAASVKSAAALRGTDGRTAEGWLALTTYHPRRTRATLTYDSLALRASSSSSSWRWGGWAMTESGRETVRENYLGPEPDRITESAIDHLGIA